MKANPQVGERQKSTGNLGDLAEEENEKLNAIVAAGGPTKSDDLSFCVDRLYFCPSPDAEPPFDMRSLLKTILSTTQEMLKKAKNRDPKKNESATMALDAKRAAAIDAAAYIHGEIVAIQPFERASNRLARFITHIICAQNCIYPVFLDDRALYRQALIEQIKAGTSHALRDLILQLLNHAEEYMSCFSLENDRLKPLPKFSNLLLSELDRITDRYRSLATQIDSLANRSSGKCFRICATCKKKESSRNQLSRCSKCHTALYCSKACQQRDWQRHRIECLKVKE